MKYSVKVTANKVVFGEMFEIKKSMNANCVEEEMRALDLIDKVFRSAQTEMQTVEVYNEDYILCGRIERNRLGAITVYAYRSNMLGVEITEVWGEQEAHRLTAIEVRSIIHLMIL